jgi:hypothetical protein
MASNLSTIGFEFEREEDFGAMMSRLAANAVQRLSSPNGEYAIWRSASGAEIWFHMAPENGNGGPREILGLTPFFEGASEVRLKVTKAVRRPNDNVLEGAFYGWVGPDEDTGEGSYPLVFDAVDFAAHAPRDLPAVWRSRLVGFARELAAYPSLDAFRATQQAQAPQAPLDGQAFIPMGLFANAVEGGTAEVAEIPSSSALFTGQVKEHRLFTNEETGRSFHWMLIDTLDATYDLLADPDVVRGDIVVGGTVDTACWFFGRILD